MAKLSSDKTYIDSRVKNNACEIILRSFKTGKVIKIVRSGIPISDIEMALDIYSENK